MNAVSRLIERPNGPKASPRLMQLLSDLIAAQRSLTRAVINRDHRVRPLAEVARTDAQDALVREIVQLETEIERVGRESNRLANLVQCYRFLLEVLTEEVPLVVEAAVKRTSVRLSDDERYTQGFLDRLRDAVGGGYAVIAGDEVRITYPGVIEILRSAERQAQLELAQQEAFQLSRDLAEVRKLNVDQARLIVELKTGDRSAAAAAAEGA